MRILICIFYLKKYILLKEKIEYSKISSTTTTKAQNQKVSESKRFGSSAIYKLLFFDYNKMEFILEIRPFENYRIYFSN